MKFFIAILTVVALASAEHSDEDKQKWLDFKLEHGKMFLSKNKEEDRMNTFLKNAKKVEEHNEAFQNGEVHYETQTHKHSDLSDADFLARFSGVNMPAEARTIDPSQVVTMRGTPPASLNLTAVMGPTWKVRDQASCGSCWTFSTGGSVEYAFYKKTGKVVDVAEQQMVDCVYGTAGGCQGGWMPKAFDFVANNGGLAMESSYPYTAVSGTCKTSVTKSVFLNKTKSYVQVASDDLSIKTALAEKGALAICVDASNWSSYRSGVFTSTKYGAPSCTHAVVLVGYGTDSATKVPYWLVRNSWGSSWWGEQGNIRLDARRDTTTGKPYGGIMLNYAYYAQLA